MAGTGAGYTCYFEEGDCFGPLWQCRTCKNRFCAGKHSHVTEKGHNAECPECESARQAAEIPDVRYHPAVGRLAGIDDVLRRLGPHGP